MRLCVLFCVDIFFFFFFFFKQKTAYEIMPSLVGSEMCIRDSNNTISHVNGNNFTQTSQQTYLNQGSNYTRAVNCMSSKQTDINSQNGFRLSFKKMLLNTSLNINYHKYDGNSMRTLSLIHI
eukprot:TRINITY_DN32471_c0_g1_i1.p2 TRINITY_DN32471_c0_g1~~TRINITY_DN32471_c0_g1_i1.p2  ORF type:complete len:122 (-),score=19.73 TRINITY_DN32471_c0_g1_i1:103-468(-)